MAKTPAPFSAGDIVQLKSGGPVMTVAGVSDSGIRCQWFSGRKAEAAFFPAQSLKLASQAEK